MAKDLIIALDFPTKEETFSFLSSLGDARPYVKVGMELYYGAGHSVVRDLKERGHSVFLDLKLHDIPNTVKSVAAVLSDLGADMINIHATGGSKMMEAAKEGLGQISGLKTLLIAVTVLTSTSEEVLQKELMVPHSPKEVASKLALLAKDAGCDGVVCSALEVPDIKALCGEDFVIVTPGIRFAGASADDQARIVTPRRARELSSDYIVVGRPITQASSPRRAYERALAEFLGR